MYTVHMCPIVNTIHSNPMNDVRIYLCEFILFLKLYWKCVKGIYKM